MSRGEPHRRHHHRSAAHRLLPHRPRGNRERSPTPTPIPPTSGPGAVSIGAENLGQWRRLRAACGHDRDQDFAAFLLGLAQHHVAGKQSEEKGKETIAISETPVQSEEPQSNVKLQPIPLEADLKNTKNYCDKNHDKNKIKRKHVTEKTEDKKQSEKITSLNISLPMVIVEKMEINFSNFDKTLQPEKKIESPVKELNDSVESKTVQNVESKVKSERVRGRHRKKHKSHSHDDKHVKLEDGKKLRHKQEKSEKNKKKTKHHDIRKAPLLNSEPAQPEPVTEPPPLPEEPAYEPVETIKTELQRVAIKIKLCSNCNTRHLQDACPLKNALSAINDSVTHSSWVKTHDYKESLNAELSDGLSEDMQSINDIKIDKGEDSDSTKDNSMSFSQCSVPNILYLEESDTAHGLSVFAKYDIKEYTQFGPLIGKVIKEVDVPEDFGMRHLWEIYTDRKTVYINSEDVNVSNWIRYMRPAPTRDVRNVSAVCSSDKLYMVTTRTIVCGEELLYWQDDAMGTNKKKMEKTNCGGCNLTFAHPLYYRTHCSVFHDVRYSLTIRKYHCKVCGAAILGKDNIMKHAVELHNGQGAYQCQFCKKFFLRLNYLEMHRTYGCAANPHRSRPLCDFCGRKFCQPQKLKVHIKRMHSDMAEVLREFQCKSCLKLLGSRAALQRHVKEVHQKQVDDSCTCVRCGKLFQNKSNLKIHMLTHSGVKPFKCKEDNCNAAFTTKQCLQFHYKKVHGFSEEIMPKIERSVEYTFAAYAGVKDSEGNIKHSKKKKESQIENNLMCLDESTDVDDISLDGKTVEDPPPLHSPAPIISEHSSQSDQTPPMLESYPNNRNTKILSKGSKKWLGDEPTLNLVLPVQKEMYSFKETPKSEENILEVDETQQFDRSKLSVNLNVYNRHESSNASLLVEAALDSVSDIQMSTSEPNIDVGGSQSCTDSLVNNLYSLSHQDNLPDVPYNHNEDLNESRDINLISPSVNDHISVTDHDLNDELPNRGISLDYGLHHNEFSPPNSPNLQNRTQLMHDYNIHNSPHTPRSRLDYTLGHDSEIVSPGNSPPRYDFHQTTENLSSDESNGIVAQNLSLNNSKDKVRLDMSYKHYGILDQDLTLRKYDSMRKYDMEDRNKLYDLALDERGKNYDGMSSDMRNNMDSMNKQYSELEADLRTKTYDNIEHSDMKMKQFEVDTEFRNKYHEEDNGRNKYDQMDSKYDDSRKDIEIDELRTKSYDIESDRSKSYENSLETEIRNKTYDVMDNLEMRNKTYDSIVDTEFRTDRNFEPLVLNPTELQGLDMSARSYHNFHPSGAVQGINRYHHLYSDLERPSVDLRLGYSPPPPPYTHSDVLRVVSLDLTPPGRHSVDLSLRSHPLHGHQLPNSRLLAEHSLQANRLISTDHNLSANRILSEHNRLTLDQSRLLTSEHNLTGNRLLGSETRLLPETGNRLISDHTTNRLLSNDQIAPNRLLTDQSRAISDDSRLLTEQSRLLDQSRILNDSRLLQPTPANTPGHELIARGGLSPAGYSGYPVSPSPYHATSLARTHGNSPGHTATGYHHYSAYY